MFVLVLPPEVKSGGAFAQSKSDKSRFLSQSFRALKRSCFLAQLLSEFVNIHGMFVRLFAELVSSQVIFFVMGDGRCCVRVGRKVMKFCSSLVCSL